MRGANRRSTPSTFGLGEWLEFDVRLDNLAHDTERCAKQVRELRGQALTWRRPDGDAERDGCRPPEGWAGADGPDAFMSFPKPTLAADDRASPSVSAVQ